MADNEYLPVEYFDDDCDLGDDDEPFDCGMGPDGQCDQAGTEWCDWECPLSHDIGAARIEQMKESGDE